MELALGTIRLDIDYNVAIAVTLLSLATGLVVMAANPVTITFASLIYLFYGVQLFDAVTIVLHELHPAFPPIPLCYVCGAVGGTWLITGLYLGLLPLWTMMFLSGMSVVAVMEWLAEDRDWNLWIAAFVCYHAMYGVWFVYDVLVVQQPGQFFLGGGLLLVGAFLHHTASLVDTWREQAAEHGTGTYYNVEENVVFLVGTLTVVTVVHLI